MSRSARGRDPDSGTESAEQQGEPCDGGREDEIDGSAERAAGQHGLPRLYIGEALHAADAPDRAAADPEPVDHDPVKPVHDHEKECGLPQGRLKVRSAVPEREDRGQRGEHDEAERDHEAFALPRDGLFFRQSPPEGLLLIFLRIKIQAAQPVVPRRSLDQQEKQQAIEHKLFLLFCWLFCLIVIAAFADMVAGTFNAYTVVDGVTQLADAAQTNGAAGMVSIMFMVFAVVFGLVQKKLNLSGWKEAVVGVLCITASFAVGMNCPLVLDKTAWSYITFVYIFFAAVLPMWLLKQPRDYMTTFMFIGMIAGAVIGLFVAHPTMNLPVFTGFNNEKLGTMFPILFVTVACGAVSGFHSLVSSGTSSKTVENEKDMLKVGYGAMVLESLLAVLALCVAGAAAAADGTPAAGTPFQIFSRGVAGFFQMFGVPTYAATVFMTMCVSALALTSLDAVARIARMSFQELFSVDDMAHAEPWRKLLCNTYFSTVLTLVLGYVLTQIGYSNIWPLFGSANQLLSALVLITLCVFLKVTGRSNKMLFPPLIIMLCVTFTALVQRLMAMVRAIQNAAAVTIPAGETTWGAVFVANGLQLIIAVLLIVLGATIVVNSMRSYVASKHNSEAKA